MKRFLLLAGVNYYPWHGTGDWVDTFDTREEAAERGKAENPGGWYCVVDLQEWKPPARDEYGIPVEPEPEVVDVPWD